MKHTKVAVLMLLVLALVAIGHHQLTQVAKLALSTDFVSAASAMPQPSESPSPTPSPSPSPSLGLEGCTPGFWKASQHFASWVSYTPQTTLGSVFNIGGTLGNATFLQALSFQGGSDLQAAMRLLLRAAVAALLNAANPEVEYPITEATIISSVNAALASNNRDTILTLASQLDGFNNLGCPLD